MKKHYTIGAMKKIARKRNGKCLSDVYENGTTHLQWQCDRGHIWEARPQNIIRGSWCHICANNKRIEILNNLPSRKLTIELIQELAQRKGGKCLSSEYIDSYTNLLWQCSKGHTWQARSSSIKRGTWCPVCAGIKLTIEDMQARAQEKGGKCLSEKYINNKTKLKWQCSKGHIWESYPRQIQIGYWCPICGRKKSREKLKLTIEEMQQIAINRGGQCLSDKYINSVTRLRWSCSENHVWEATPRNIKSGSWCPTCARKNKRNTGPRKSKSYKYTIQDMQDLALSREGKCLSFTYEGFNKKLIWQCKEGHIWKTTPAVIKNSSWCPTCSAKKGAEKLRLTLEEIHHLAALKGGKCLSDKYINANTKLKWQCSKGHVWEATPSSIKNDTWCGQCSIDDKKLNLEEMQTIANLRGGKCLSKEYKNSRTKLEWRCMDGHTWDAIPNQIKRGSWCPICARRNTGKNRKRTIDDIRKIAKSKGLECLSDEYKNAYEELIWRCSNGHIWNARPSTISKGILCPICNKEYVIEKIRLIFEQLFTASFLPSYIEDYRVHGYNKSLNIAFIYNIELQFKKFFYLHESKQNFINSLQQEIEFKKYCKDNDIKLIWIPHKFTKTHEKLSKYITSTLKKLGIHIYI